VTRTKTLRADFSDDDDDYQVDRTLDGAQKAAALLLAMGKPSATRILKHFDPQELRNVTRAAAHLGSVSNATLEALVEEFTASFSVGAHLQGDIGQAREMLADAVPPDQVAGIISDALGLAQPSTWDLLASIPDKEFAAYLGKERLSTTTYILSKLDAAVAGKVIACLTRSMRNDVFCGLISPPVISEMAARIVEESLREDLLTVSARPPASAQRARVAQLLNGLDESEVGDVMRRLSEVKPEDAKLLQSMLFSFNDLPRLSQRARALLFDKVSIDAVILSLRGVEADFRDVVLGSMASRSRRLVEAELANGADVPPRDIVKARKQIADLVLSMAQRNEIEIPPPDANAVAPT
jgi:flagellar motor switch protein FliG